MPRPCPPADLHLAECVQPGLTIEQTRLLAGSIDDELVRALAPAIRLVGTLLVLPDEVALFLFDQLDPETDATGAVGSVCAAAGVPIERTLHCRWLSSSDSQGGHR